MKTLPVLLLAVIVLGIGFFWFTAQSPKEKMQPTAETTSQTNTETGATVPGEDHGDMTDAEMNAATDVGMEMPIPDSEVVVNPNAKVFEVLGENFAFDKKEIRVKEGDTVVINFKSVDGFHDWVVDEFDARTAKIQTGGSTQVTFVASKKGTFEYYCSIGSHRAKGMVGTLIVE